MSTTRETRRKAQVRENEKNTDVESAGRLRPQAAEERSIINAQVRENKNNTHVECARSQATKGSTSTEQTSSTERTTSTEQTTSTERTASTEQSASTKHTSSTERTASTKPSTQARSAREKANSTNMHEVRQRDSSLGTVVNRAVNKKPGSRASSSSSKKRAFLEARLELEKREKEKAEAAAALARTRMELIELEERDSSDLSDIEGNDDLVSQWVHKSIQSKPVSEAVRTNHHEDYFEPRRKERQSDAAVLASAIADAMKSVTRSAPTTAPRYINELHRFDGNPGEWIPFRATYEDTEKYFSESENIARLRKSLFGQARDAVKSLLYTNAPPQEILKSLERRFGKPLHLIKSEIAAINRIPPMTADIKGIGVFASTVANSVNTIKQLNRTDYLYSNDVSERIIDKMNMMVKFRWYEYWSLNDQQPILLALSAFLNRIADQFEAYDCTPTTYKSFQPREAFKGKPRRNMVHATREESEYSGDESSTYSYSEEEEDSETEIVATATHETLKCKLCGKDGHTLIKCPQYEKASTQERWEIVKRIKVCFRCLRQNHRSPTCRAKPCGKDNCPGRHHVTLHRDKPKPVEKDDANKIVSVNHISATRAYLKIVPVEISGPQGTTRVTALMDEGSTVTLLLNEVADKIGAQGPTEELSIEGVGGHRMKSTDSMRLKLRIKGQFTREYHDMDTLTIGQLNLATQAVYKEDLENCPHLACIADQLTYDRERPSLLIGQDNWHLIVSRELKAGKTTKPVASLTKLGWVLHGCHSHEAKPVKFVNHIHSQSEEKIETLIKEHFSLDSLGISPKRPASDPEQRALMLLDKTTKRLPEGRFECGLLWRKDDEIMPNNKESALRRLKGIERKMKKDEAFKISYKKQIDNLLASGYAEPVTSAPTTPRAWYLPHFAVVHPQKGKMRLVFDAADRSHGKSLNDALLSGPDLLQSLFGVLIRFREGPIAVAADIKEMFLRVAMREEDRDSLRFLWREKETEEPREYRMKALIFGASSSPCSAIYVKNKNAKEFENTHPEAVRAIERCHYMDDYLQSFKTEAEAQKTAQDVDQIHKHGGFELRGWASNRSTVIQQLQTVKPEEQVKIGQDGQTEKTLGMLWNIGKDTLQYTLNLRNTPRDVIDGTRPPTKRQVTSAVMSVFDPLNIATPVLIQGKKLIQHLWREGISWDEEIPERYIADWKEWIQGLEQLQSLHIPRCTFSCDEGEMHTFVDASETTYAAATYWRTTQDGIPTVRLVAAKARVAPLKITSIPRLELQAALLGCRLASNVENENSAKVTRKYYWSDSRTVLAWIKSDPRTFKPFMAHRLAEIEELSKTTEWRWVPTNENVADDATRRAPREFDPNHRWFNGPAFLKNPPTKWPVDRSEPSPVPAEENKKTVAAIKVVHTEIPNPQRFSKWTRLLRATARLLQCVDVFKQLLKHEKVTAIKRTVKDSTWRKYDKKKQSRPSPLTAPALTHRTYLPIQPEYLQSAENLLIKTVQRESFNNEIKCITNNKPLEKDSRLKRLSLKIAEDILKLDTRICAANCISDTYKHPVVLDGRHRITKLLVAHYHSKFNHGNIHTIMNEIRQKYYITSLRAIVKTTARECQWCRTHKTAPLTAPIGDLPAERLTPYQPPFTYTAVDYFGPLTITVGRKTEKRWVALYTCMTTRAVHLEIATSLTANDMILTLRRFAARRGMCSVLYSDNGGNFVRANSELKTEFEKLKDLAGEKGIKWKFIPPGAPHMGGTWERLVRTVKTALYATLKERQPREEVLHTLLLEAEHLVNSRPLTPPSLDPNEEESLTPSHFLIGRSNGCPRIGDFDENTLIGTPTWRTVQYLTDTFWNRWLKEYLPTLSPRPNTENHPENLKPGDIVLIVDSNLPRGVWPRGEIMTIHPGPDGRTRIVDVRTVAGTLRRPITRLVKIT
ncbi:uncharacterized protein LOC125489902 [Plutella xylostella]|uniref:uncharacterized protein LOC125489902 n=1 Tax=Plutella xylostella TaxID=51655 RepID=UPI00203308F4|nr:uncharacterized protein LOC125489902 [Plutella xylostella]